MRRYYRIAGCTCSVESDLDLLPRAFAPFLAENADNLVLEVVVHDVADLPATDSWLIDEEESDMGRTRLYNVHSGYRIDMCRLQGNFVHTMLADNMFRRVDAYLDNRDVWIGEMLGSMLRTAFAQVVLQHDGVSIHASAVSCRGRAYLFLGRSGTGKSTHSMLWLGNICGSELINDDNPIVRIVDGSTVVAYGSPWSGKTPCYRNVSCPVGGIVRLHQSSENVFMLRHDVDAFITILPGCSGLKCSQTLRNALASTVIRIAELVPVADMDCLPDAAAAELCAGGFGIE